MNLIAVCARRQVAGGRFGRIKRPNQRPVFEGADRHDLLCAQMKTLIAQWVVRLAKVDIDFSRIAQETEDV